MGNETIGKIIVKGPFLVLYFSYYTLTTLPYDFIYNIAICANDTTFSSKCDQVSDLWQQLELASELESDLRDTVDNAEKTQFVLFNWSNNTGVIDVKIG